MTMLSALAKTYYAGKTGLAPDDIFMLAVMPCVAKKYEAGRKEHVGPNGRPYTDAVMTTREMIWMMKSMGIDFKQMPDEDFDAPLGISTGAADIFGTTGGVMEAALRTAYEVVTGQPCEDLEFTQVRAVEGLREASIEIDGHVLNVAVANGLSNAKKILDKVLYGEKQFHMIEIMACPGGCIGGGGQPYPPAGMHVLARELVKMRARALYTIARGKKMRKSHENPAVKALYDEFLGEPNGHKSHELLHTHYEPKSPRGIR